MAGVIGGQSVTQNFFQVPESEMNEIMNIFGYLGVIILVANAAILAFSASSIRKTIKS